MKVSTSLFLKNICAESKSLQMPNTRLAASRMQAITVLVPCIVSRFGIVVDPDLKKRLR